ncbi:MAG: hypothetical protein WKF94_05395 [Solirubrobacteraceae bacterium]
MTASTANGVSNAGFALREALLASADRLALVAIPTATFARAEGVSGLAYLRYRAGLLLAVSTGADELRAAGWTLDVQSLTGQEAAAVHEGAERVFVITATNHPQQEN